MGIAFVEASRIIHQLVTQMLLCWKKKQQLVWMCQYVYCVSVVCTDSNYVQSRHTQ